MPTPKVHFEALPIPIELDIILANGQTVERPSCVGLTSNLMSIHISYGQT